jgi:hypothetical protein
MHTYTQHLISLLFKDGKNGNYELGWKWWPEYSGLGQGTIAGFFEYVSKLSLFMNRNTINAVVLNNLHHAHIYAQFIYFFKSQTV